MYMQFVSIDLMKSIRKIFKIYTGLVSVSKSNKSSTISLAKKGQDNDNY